MNNKIKFRVLAFVFCAFCLFELASNWYYFRCVSNIYIPVRNACLTKFEDADKYPASVLLQCRLQLIQNEVQVSLNRELNKVIEKNYTRPFFIQIYGLALKQIHPYLIRDEWYDIIRLKNEHLIIRAKKHEYSREARMMVHFNKILAEKKIPFIFVLAPHKVSKYAPMSGTGVTDYSNENADFYLNILRKGNVEVLDSREILKDSPELHYEWFYKTDTHWKTEYAFRVFQELAPILKKHGLKIEPQALEKNNYTILYGGKINDMTQRLGSWYMPEDLMQVMQPKWETRLDLKSQWSKLDYSDTFPAFDFIKLYPDLAVHNQKAKTHKKILFFSDSFGQIFTGFLSFACSHMEVRILNQYSGNLLREIEEFQPDVVIGMFNARDSYPHCYKFGLPREESL